MPKGNLTLIRNSDSSVVTTGISTVKSAKVAALNDSINRIKKNNLKGNYKETYSIVVPKESFAVNLDATAVGTSTDDTEKLVENFSKAEFVS